ncbi:hypothetical protein [Brevundimonas sp. R86498]|uniref:hypothetical protein n=1 Tax=Brevundimonas sp. R86498 TaxID=3093845 RepID=UPI0037CBC0AF
MSRPLLPRLAVPIVVLLTGCGGGSSGGSGEAPGPVTPPPPPASGPPADCPAGLSNAGLVANGTLRACQLPASITGDLTLSARAGTVYAISGLTQVGADGGVDPAVATGRASLTLEPGVRLYGSSAADQLIVHRGSRLFAEGTTSQPVIFTSRQNIDGTTTETSQGQWGGIVIAGRAPQANCSVTPVVSCSGTIEGTAVAYGGNTPEDNSGRLRHVQIRYAGGATSGGSTAAALALGAVGSGTTIDHVQVHNSAADGISLPGGTVNLRYLVVTGADDDGLDMDLGWRGVAQFGIVTQRPTTAAGRSSGLEFSSAPATTPRAGRLLTAPVLANFTVVGRASTSDLHTLVHLETGADPAILDAVFTRPAGSAAACLDIADDETFDSYPLFGSVLMSCPVPYVPANGLRSDRVFNVFRGTNRPNALSSLTAPTGASLTNQGLTFINGATENGATAASTGGLNPFLQPTGYVGAVRNAEDGWYRSWTCGLQAGAPC